MPPKSLTISTGVPNVRQRIDLEDLERLDARQMPPSAILVEQRVEHRARLVAVLGEDVTLLARCPRARGA